MLNQLASEIDALTEAFLKSYLPSVNNSPRGLEGNIHA